MSETVVGLVSAFMLGVLGTALKYVNAYISSHFKPRQLGALFDLARTAVAAAQQWGGVKNLEKTGAEKLEYAKQIVEDAAKHIGLKVTDAEIEGFIHSALREIKEQAAFVMNQAA